MRTGLLTMILTLAALNAAAKTAAFSPLPDPLTTHIISGFVRGTSEITGVSRDASGKISAFKIVEPLSSSVAPQPLRDAVADNKALAGLQPAAGLAMVKKAPKKGANTKDPLAAKRQLKKISEKKWPRK